MDCCRKEAEMPSFFVGDFELFIAREPTDSRSAPVDDRQAKKSDISRMLDGSSSTKREMKDFNSKLLESLFDGEESKKFSTNLYEVSPSDGQDPMWDDDDDSSVDEARNELILADSKWIDDDDSSVDEELLQDYLERLDAKHLTKKEVEWKVDDGLSEVKADAYHSLTSLQRMNWITLQFILERYDPPFRSRRVRTPPPPGAPKKRHWIFCHTDSEDSDLEDSDQEDCISD